ncbi:YiiX/YebB-like N1pC/P60 family cysteine hydrolase [Elizabethkingia sp. JS20170427COW]|uniref:YiiX/YebB-like N1pC/P60 family cysteine hydrolase n=1 Tax=Elizabethkingia sp. JS20170427COW TaxID=2583851 RepID=UPI001629051A|nr:YiiX/YebB-like N1pC/P60 family cysteine hydrolase [Elizabethkingia sp. JS20170427COW]
MVKSWLYYLGLMLVVSCTSTKVTLRNGDLLLVPAAASSLSGAIDRVTQTAKETHYSHIALLEKDSIGDFFVLHAGSRNGSERLSLADFFKYEAQKGVDISVYRLKSKYQSSIPAAIHEAKKWLGRPYNYSYILSDQKLYCSDFVQRSFAKDSIFTLEPMTFINPQTGKTDKAWEEFYSKQNLEIPEGKPGCNPNGLAASPKVRKVGKISYQYK